MHRNKEFSPALSVLDRHAVRKAVRESGFDILDDLAEAVIGESSHAKEKCIVLTQSNNGFVAALTMGNVVHALESDFGIALPPESFPGAPFQIAGGFEIKDIPDLEALLKRAWVLARTLPNALVWRFDQAVIAISETEREATVRQRVGQNLFREGLLALWGGRCAITGLDAPELLRASHAKPWADSSDIERLDVFNGLLLAAHWDAAFDSGLITISISGHVVQSAALSDATVDFLKLPDDVFIRLQPQHEPYLSWHRERVFKRP